MTLSELQAKRDEVLADIDTASVRAASGASKDFLMDKRRVLSILDDEIEKLTASGRLRRTVITTSKGL